MRGHLIRGALALAALTGAVVMAWVWWPATILLIALGMLALRGCPACWVMRLVELVSLRRLQRSCDDGVCRLERPAHSG
ncbi:hypothetical protein [Longispora albida]|uniref:hypothetical protein n=1 Tax=Longispora albida TaxID=203523 RepID=UPI0003674913|nr:hypothetical protein [Longispora albida]